MKNKFFLLLSSLAVSALLVAPAFALEEISYSDYDFEKQNDLQGKLENQSEKIDNRIDDLGENAPQGVINELKEARDEIDAAINKVSRANEDSWDQVRDVVEHDINNTQKELFEAGAFADNYDLDGSDDWWDVK